MTALQYDSRPVGQTATFPILIQSTGYAGSIGLSTPSIVANTGAPTAQFTYQVISGGAVVTSVTVAANASVALSVQCPLPASMTASPYYTGTGYVYPNYSISLTATATGGSPPAKPIGGLVLTPLPFSQPGLPTVSPALSTTPLALAVNSTNTFTFTASTAGGAGYVAENLEFRFQDPALGADSAPNDCGFQALIGSGTGTVFMSDSSGNPLATHSFPGSALLSNSVCQALWPTGTITMDPSQNETVTVPLVFSTSRIVHLYVRTQVAVPTGAWAWSGWRDLGVVKTQ